MNSRQGAQNVGYKRTKQTMKMARFHVTIYSLRRLTLRWAGSIAGGVGVRPRFLAASLLSASAASSGILCNSRIIFKQYFCFSLPLSSSVFLISSRALCKLSKRSYASSFHPPYFFWPSLVSVHLAWKGFASSPFLGMEAPVQVESRKTCKWKSLQMHLPIFSATYPDFEL